MSYADPGPRWNTQTNRSGALAVGIALLLVAIGGQCRGSLAQDRKLEALSAGEVTSVTSTVRVIRTTPMTAAEWSRAYDECIKHLGTPVIGASRHPGISAGIVCTFEP